jgi:hypothetical protein
MPGPTIPSQVFANKTADFFGVHYNRIAEVINELQDHVYIKDIQSGRDPKTGKHRLRIVRPTAKVTKPRTPVCIDEKFPDTQDFSDCG